MRWATRITTAFRAPQRMPLLHIVKSAIATILAWLLAGLLIPGPLPIFAAMAALLVVQPSVNQSLLKAVERSVGVIAGVVVASIVGLLLGNAAWVVLVAIVLALILAWVCRMTAGTTNQVAISAILVLALGAATPDYAVDRIIETLIGAVVGFIVNVTLVPPVAIRPAQDAVDALADETAATADRLAGMLTSPQTPASLTEALVTARLLRAMLANAEQRIATAAESLTLNPRSGRHRAELERLHALVAILMPIITQLIGMTRATADLFAPGLVEQPESASIAMQLTRAAADIQRLAHGTPATPADEPPALTAPLTVRAPSAEHWILIGSLLVDLRRIHDILGETD